MEPRTARAGPRQDNKGVRDFKQKIRADIGQKNKRARYLVAVVVRTKQSNKKTENLRQEIHIGIIQMI